MKKIVLLPLDERPCNNDFPKRLFNHDDIEIKRPEILGQYKTPADYEKIKAFLLENAADADAMVISMDMLIYGGLIPSRLHHEKIETLLSRMEVLREIRKKNPKLLIYAFQCIMRCPDYSSSDEEPDYYASCGQQIHDLGTAVHMARHGEDRSREINALRKEIGLEAIDDYISRRDMNRRINLETLNYLTDHTLDSLVIPRDDSQKYGYPAMDEEVVRGVITELDLTEKVLSYPGADEVELTLISRVINKMAGIKPKVYVKYASEKAKDIVPLYEGCELATTIRYHIMSAGCQMTDGYEQADIILVITAPSSNMQEAVIQPVRTASYSVDRLMVELVEFIKDRIAEGKIVTIGDDAYANGADLELLHLLDHAGILMKVDGYAGWNTNANTLGTAIAEAVDSLHYGKTKGHRDFLLERYLEDGGYCAKVREAISEKLPECGALHFTDNKTETDTVNQIRRDLKAFLRESLPSIEKQAEITQISLPWHRMFEVDLEAEYSAE